MKDYIKGFMFGAALMLMSPAFAVPGAPKASGEQAQPAAQAGLPYFRLTYEDAQEALGQALSERGAGSKISTTITTRGEQYIFSYNQPISVEIRGLRYDANTHRFTANLVSVSEGKVVSAKPIAGRYDEMVEVPVLRRSVRAGETIKAEDLELRDYTTARARMDTITDMSSLIGKSPLRVITSGRPIRLHELEQPAAVKKNDVVSMIYNRGGMSITTKGQAVDSGAAGATIGVRNIDSKKVIQARVIDANTVSIEDANTHASIKQTVSDIYEN